LLINSITGFSGIQNTNTNSKKLGYSSIGKIFSPLKMDKFESQKNISFNGSNPEKLVSDLNRIVQGAKDSGVVLDVKKGFIKQIVQRIIQKPNNPVIIAISGEPASGKTTLAKNITDTITKFSSPEKRLISSISCDNYYEDLTKQLKTYGDYTEILNRGYDPHNPATQDLSLLSEHLSALKLGKDVLIPDYNFASCESIPNQIKIPASKTILYEWIFALNPIFKDLSDIKIYVDAPSKVIEDRYLKRAVSRGKDETAAKKLFFDLSDSTQKYIASARENANLTINGNSKSEKIVSFINQIYSALK